jgi:hypothetical protein
MLRSLLTVLAAVCLLPDEGQWLPTQVREMDWAALKLRGMEMSKDDFWHPEKGGVLSATVQINGCTASFVSAGGLMVTNHHCGFGAVSALSTPESNHLRDGFTANTREAELPAPGMVATVLKRIENVTAKVHAAQAEAKSDLDRWRITQQTIAKLTSEGERSEANTKCSVASFLEGKEYHLYFRTQIRDVRLVYAPPRAIGEFGGDVDNWEWPRHTGDFTFFRAYVGKDGSVQDYSDDNVPFQPEHFLKTATQPIKENDIAIIMGYPGSTQRYKTSRGVASQEGYVFPARLRVLTRAIDVLNNASQESEERSLALVSKIKSLANVQKNAAGMIFGLKNNAVVARKMREEAQLAAHSKDNAGLLKEMLADAEQEGNEIEKDTNMWFIAMLRDHISLFDILMQGCNATARGGEISERGLKMIGSDGPAADFDLIQRTMLTHLMTEWANISAGQRLTGTDNLTADGGRAVIDTVFATTQMLDGQKRRELFAGGKQAVESSDDPLIVLARGINKEYQSWLNRRRTREGRKLDVGRRWIAAQEAFRGKSFYPDANSTLRVSIASVKSYEPRDGVHYKPQTTVAGLLQKENGKTPFANPKALLEAAKTRKDSRWYVPALGDVPVCFLTDGDTTGGNSGSPVINGRGELIGLNFDRVFENVAGDFGWNPERSRNVVCDFRYVLWVLEEVQPAPNLLKELGV